jgi:hypothetical protein
MRQAYTCSLRGGAFGEPLINMLDLILTLRHRRGAPA